MTVIIIFIMDQLFVTYIYRTQCVKRSIIKGIFCFGRCRIAVRYRFQVIILVTILHICPGSPPVKPVTALETPVIRYIPS